MTLLLSPKGRTRRLQRRALSALCSLCSRPSRRLSGPPSSASSPLPHPYRVIGMVMIAFVGGSHVRQTWDGCHLDPPGGHLGKPEAPVEERHTGSFLLLLRFLRSCAWCGCRCTRFLDSRDDLQDPRHTGFSPHRRGEGVRRRAPLCRLGEHREGSLLLLLLCGWLSLACSSHLPHQSEVFTLRSLRKKRKKRRK
jgi:hypothetical protein